MTAGQPVRVEWPDDQTPLLAPLGPTMLTALIGSILESATTFEAAAPGSVVTLNLELVIAALKRRSPSRRRALAAIGEAALASGQTKLTTTAPAAEDDGDNIYAAMLADQNREADAAKAEADADRRSRLYQLFALANGGAAIPIDTPDKAIAGSGKDAAAEPMAPDTAPEATNLAQNAPGPAAKASKPVRPARPSLIALCQPFAPSLRSSNAEWIDSEFGPNDLGYGL